MLTGAVHTIQTRGWHTKSPLLAVKPKTNQIVLSEIQTRGLHTTSPLLAAFAFHAQMQEGKLLYMK